MLFRVLVITWKSSLIVFLFTRMAASPETGLIFQLTGILQLPSPPIRRMIKILQCLSQCVNFFTSRMFLWMFAWRRTLLGVQGNRQSRKARERCTSKHGFEEAWKTAHA